MSEIKVDERRDVFPSAAFKDGVSIVGGIQKELFNAEFREVCFHRERDGETKACHAGRPVLKEETQGDCCRNRKPHTCRDNKQKNSIPGESPISSCSQAGNNGAYS